MTAQVWLLVGTVVTAVGGVVGTYLLVRQQGRQTKTTDAQQIIDQLQENNGAAESRHQRELAMLSQRHSEEIAEVRGQVAELRDRVSRMEDRELAHFDYEYRLRAHIDQRKPPPPPQWPPELMHRLPRDRG